MESKRVGPARRRLAWAATAAGLITVTAVVASSVAGATPFLPNVPGFTQLNASEGTVELSGLRQFPVLYASVGISSRCEPGIIDSKTCPPSPHVFTLTKPVDASTPALAESAATGKLHDQAVIVIRSGSGVLITYTLEQVRVADDNQQFETIPSESSAATVKEQVALAYRKIRWAVGVVKTGYDWAINAKI